MQLAESANCQAKASISTEPEVGAGLEVDHTIVGFTAHSHGRSRCLIYRLAALLLVLLAASPFTAPFSTCDDAVFAMHDGVMTDHGADTDSAVCDVVPATGAPLTAWSPAIIGVVLAHTGTAGPSLYSLRL